MDGKKHGSEDRKHREQRREEEKRREEGGERQHIFLCFLGLTTFDQSRDLRSWTPSLKF